MPQEANPEQDDELTGWAIPIGSKSPETKRRMARILDLIETMSPADLQLVIKAAEEEQERRRTA